LGVLILRSATKFFVDMYEEYRNIPTMSLNPSSIASGPPRPTDAELAILRVLWRRGPSSVRQVMDALNRQQPTGYTTVLKMLQIMTEKGLVEREEEGRLHVYEPIQTESETQRQLLGDLLDRAFNGSARQLVLQALATKPASPEELAEIRRLLDQLEKGNA
jgi:BlaI family transcriptional regulator, penicillinase repressor